jgi:hypothetical protein
MANSSDTKAITVLVKEIGEFSEVVLGHVVERGAELMREEVPKKTHRLEAGVSSTVDYRKLTGEIVVSAESDRKGARQGTLHLANDKTKAVELAPVDAYNYAEVVALGNKDSELIPKRSSAFLIPVDSKPATGAYIVDGSQIFVVRTKRKGQKANPYHERAGERLEKEIPAIGKALAEEFFQ